jgi:hypothetical protein
VIEARGFQSQQNYRKVTKRLCRNKETRSMFDKINEGTFWEKFAQEEELVERKRGMQLL